MRRRMAHAFAVSLSTWCLAGCASVLGMDDIPGPSGVGGEDSALLDSSSQQDNAVAETFVSMDGHLTVDDSSASADGALDTKVVDSPTPDTRFPDSAVGVDGTTTDASPPDTLPRADTTADAVATDASDAAEVGCPTGGGDPCARVVRLLSTQTIDGLNQEFCAVPPVRLSATNAGLLLPTPAAAWASASVEARFAWSADGLHAHFAVADATIAPAPSTAEHYNGDSIELFTAGHTALTGPFDGTVDKGALHIVFTRPASDGSTRAGIYYQGPVSGGTAEGGLPLRAAHRWLRRGGAAHVELARGRGDRARLTDSARLRAQRPPRSHDARRAIHGIQDPDADPRELLRPLVLRRSRVVPAGPRVSAHVHRALTRPWSTPTASARPARDRPAVASRVPRRRRRRRSAGVPFSGAKTSIKCEIGSTIHTNGHRTRSTSRA